ncbi:MAG: PLP-dependent aspartate aminotransferase family protein [Pseudomonadota bacterium]
MAEKPVTSATILARLGGLVDPGSGGLVPPLQASTTYVRGEDYNLVYPENSYGRDNNEQVRLAESLICQLEHGADTKLFASGMAAISTLVSALRAGECLLLQSGMYWGAVAWIRKFCKHRAIDLIEEDSSDTQRFCEFIQKKKPRLILIEVPSNPWIKLSDIQEIANAARTAGSALGVDATAATPILLQPLKLGADFVIHSATKAINGHSDVLAGVISCANEQDPIWRHVCEERQGAGAVLSPQAAWLLLRGMRTLDLRVEKMSSNALSVAEFLQDHPEIEAVWYPGIQQYAQYDLAERLMPNGYGCLMSFLFKGGKDAALEFCRHIEGIHRATSLGGTESLIEHRHTIEGNVTGCPDNLVRLSVGIEDIQDLISELDFALAKTR